VVLVSEGARIDDNRGMIFEDATPDQYGHRKLGGIGDVVAACLKEMSPKFNDGATVNIVNQRLGYLVRCGDPDAVDAIVGMAFGNLALDLIQHGESGRLVALRNGRYDSVPLDVISEVKKKVDVERYYDVERLRPKYHALAGQPLFIMAPE
jgi:6-phosphofructokinase 1